MGQAIKNNTIVALCTPAAMGALAVVRLSGPQALETLTRVWRGKSPSEFKSHTAHLGYIMASDDTEIDQVVATYFKAPNSFTGEDTVEISCHGSVWIQQAIIDRLIEVGAMPAGPGEFSQRAFMNGRMDLAEAEAVADLIASQSKASQRLAMTQMKGEFSQRLRTLREQLLNLLSLLELELDFSEEDVEFADRSQLLQLAQDTAALVDKLADSFSIGNAIKTGIPIVLAGATNTGKSTLLNRLLQQDKAIVSDIHGTTRDIIEDTFTHRGLQYRIIDTAGLRHTDDPIENLGIDRTHDAISKAALVLWLIDATAPFSAIELPSTDTDTLIIPVINKTDIAPEQAHVLGEQASALGEQASLLAHSKPWQARMLADPKQYIPITISAKTGDGVEVLLDRIHDIFSTQAQQHDVIITNARHLAALRRASAPLHRVINQLNAVCSMQNAELTGTSAEENNADLEDNYALCTMHHALFIAQDIREAIAALSEITGDITTDDLLTNIFTHFCIGK